MTRPVRHLVSYDEPIEKTDMYTLMYEETYCGRTREYVLDEPLTEGERLKQARILKVDNRPICERCEQELAKAKGE